MVTKGSRANAPSVHRRLSTTVVAFLVLGTPAIAAPDSASPTLVDIVESRSIDSLSVSPDGRRVAFRVLSPSVSQNHVMARWYSVPLEGDGDATPLGGDHEPIWMPFFDIPLDGASRWSADSTSLFVLQMEDSQIQVHRLGPGGRNDAITHDDADVSSFSISPDERTLTYKVRNARSVISRAQAVEERQGVHLDRTVYPEGLRLTQNFRIGSRETTIRRADPSYAGEAYAGPERTIVAPLSPISPIPAGTMTVRAPNVISAAAEGASGRRLELSTPRLSVRLEMIDRGNEDLPLARYQIAATLPGGAARTCAATFCTGLSSALREVTLDETNGEAIILYEKDFSARTSIYGWNPLTGRSREILAAASSLDGGSSYSGAPCPRERHYLICVEAGPSRPPRLVRIDVARGKATSLFDPNDALAAKRFAKPAFIEWHDREGRKSNGVLMLPGPEHRRYPLVITTYRCRGFLRGGTGSVVSEHILNQLGFATLCVNLNNGNNRQQDATGQKIPLASHRATLASYEAAIEDLDRQGIIDRTRVGIAGHSFSAMTVAYAISKSATFQAAVIGTGVTIDPASYFLTAPTADSWRKSVLSSMGLPRPQEDPENLWGRFSPALNAARIKTPVLIQPPESEWLFALQLYTYIQDAGGTADMFVYPGSGHMVGRLPSHQYWRNRRSLDWFSYWLLEKTDQQPKSAARFDQLETLRIAGDVGLAKSPP